MMQSHSENTAVFSLGTPANVLLAEADTVYFSFDVSISDEVRVKLEIEKEAAQIAATVG